MTTIEEKRKEINLELYLKYPYQWLMICEERNKYEFKKAVKE